MNEIINRESANLHVADLHGANLPGTNLMGADLYNANLHHANLRGANLRGANLRGANLSGANLWGANLIEADLQYADLSGANLWGADFRDANLKDAKFLGANLKDATLAGAKLSPDVADSAIPMCCPETGSFIGWKKCRNDYIVKLEIPKGAKRSSATGRKCRCNKAKVLSIETPGGMTYRGSVSSEYDEDFIYTAGAVVSVSNFCDDRFRECAPGIHFFITRQEAVDY